jgi:hypothetical protein
MRTAVLLSLIAGVLFIMGTYRRDELIIKDGFVSLTRHERWGCKHATYWRKECSLIREVSSLYVGGVDIGPGYYRIIFFFLDGTSTALPESFDVGMSCVDVRVAGIQNKISTGGILREVVNPGKAVVDLSAVFLIFALLYWMGWIRKSKG